MKGILIHKHAYFLTKLVNSVHFVLENKIFKPMVIRWLQLKLFVTPCKIGKR
jgi:hypothetical protein